MAAESKKEIIKNRPAIIVSNNASNKHLNRLQMVPITSNTSKVFPGEAIIIINDVEYKAMANQIMTVSKKRITSILGMLSNHDIRIVEHAIRIQLGLRK